VPAGIDHRNRTRPRLARGVAVLAVGLGALTACGTNQPGNAAASTSASSTGSSASTAASSSGGAAASSATAAAQSLTATESNFAIALDSTDLKAGTYDIKVVNRGNATHNLAVEENGKTKATSDNLAPGESTTLTVALDAGKYVFYCSVGTHRAMGMELTVQVT
jgi:plastocyanin